MKETGELLPGCYYHIFNRGNNKETIFKEEKNFHYFLHLYLQHISPVADTFAYCLLYNHFHFLVRIMEQPDPLKKASQCFSNFFNAYAKAINKSYHRAGSLFQDRFGRRILTSDSDFQNLIFYIHFNPQKHGLISDFRDWKWSSYRAICSTLKTQLQRQTVLDWFGDVRQFQEFHKGLVDERGLEEFMIEDLIRG